MAAVIKLPSDRRFGLVFTVVFFALGVYGVIKGTGRTAYTTLLSLSLAVGLITLIAPRLLAPLNKLWFHFGQLLGRVVSPVVLSIIFFGILTPVAIITRACGRDELLLKRRAVDSYWIARTPPGP